MPKRKLSGEVRATHQLIFPAQKIYEMWQSKTNKIIPPECVIYLTSALEYIAYEILDMAGNVTVFRGDSEINDTDIRHAINADDDLQRLAFGIN